MNNVEASRASAAPWVPVRLFPRPRPLNQMYHAQDMTLCIGALAWEQETNTDCIVLCFDYKVTGDAFASETEYKFHELSDQIVSLVAGSPTRAKELALIYRDHLAQVQLSSLSEAQATNELRKPLATLRLRMANSYVGRRLGISFQDLLDNGVHWLGEQRRDRYLSAIEDHWLDVEMVIAGFTCGKPVLYQLGSENGVEPPDLRQSTNFCVIGIGAKTAEPALHARAQARNTPLSQTLYNVYEAKRIGEGSAFVGQRTRMHILRPPEPGGSGQYRHQTVGRKGEEWLRKLFAKYGPRKPSKRTGWPPIPVDAFSAIDT